MAASPVTIAFSDAARHGGRIAKALELVTGSISITVREGKVTRWRYRRRLREDTVVLIDHSIPKAEAQMLAGDLRIDYGEIELKVEEGRVWELEIAPSAVDGDDPDLPER